jgi:MFS family permease
MTAHLLQNHIAICVVRAISGLGMALSMPAAFGIVGISFPTEPARTIAFAVMGLGYPVGAALGQVMGGLVAGSGK